MGGRARDASGRFTKGGGSGGGQNLGTATGYVEIDPSGVTAGMETARQSFERGMQQMGTHLLNVGTRVAALGVSIGTLSKPMTDFVSSGIQTAARFDSAMAEISARTGLVGEELNKVREIALQMGADTVFSAQESADAFLQLLSSGQSAEEAISTLPAVLTAAAASGEDLGRTADVVTDIMAAFGLEVENAQAVVDSLAQAAGASSADMSSLGQGFANVGPVARQFGLDVNETAAILAIFSENGIKGAEAGTQLKSMLLNMTNDTDTVATAWKALNVSFYDANGNARDLSVVISELDMALSKLPLEQQNSIMRDLGGTYGIMGLEALRSSISIQEMQDRMAGQASAADVAAKRMDTYEGSVNSLQGSIETLHIQAMTPFMENVLKPINQFLTQLINTFSEFAEENQTLATIIITVIAVFGGLAAILTPIGIAIAAMGTAMGGLSSVMTLLTGSATAATTAMAATGTTTAAAGVAAGTAATGFTAAGVAAKVASVGVWLLNGALVVLTSPITLLIASFVLLGAVIVRWGDDAARTFRMIVQIMGILIREGFERLSRIVPGILNGLANAVRTWVEFNLKVIRAVVDAILGIPNAVKKAADAIKSLDLNRTGKGRGGLFGSGIGPDFDPIGGIRGRAGGGPVQRMTPYLVGEEGPELFMPRSSGTIINNDTLNRAGNSSQNKQFTFAPVFNVSGSDIALDDLQSMVEGVMFDFFTEAANV